MQNELLDALKTVGIEKGDTILIHSDLRPFGMPPGITGHNEILKYYLSAFQEVLGPKGTLAVPAYFYEYARFGTPFDVEHSPVSAPLGVFSAYIASLPGRIRSCNPLTSLAAIGPQAEKICGPTSLSGSGAASVWQRLRDLNGKIVFFGISMQAMTFVHYIEQLYGVPHMYLKIYNTPVIKDGKELKGFPTNSVRYLEYGIEYDIIPFQKHLIAQKKVRASKLNKGTILSVSAQEVYDEGIKCLDENIFFFLKHPPEFVPGKIPFDGQTGQLRSLQ